MKTMIKTSAVLLASLMLLAACDTTQGFGEDTSKLGHDISNSAAKNTPN
jgi:predicted small secreted protein